MLKKLLVLLVLPLLLIPFLCGCQKNSDKTVLTFSSWGSVTETQILENVIKNYENDNPNIITCDKSDVDYTNYTDANLYIKAMTTQI